MAASPKLKELDSDGLEEYFQELCLFKGNYRLFQNESSGPLRSKGLS